MNNLRVSGIDAIGDISWGTHFCQFYKTKEDLVDIIVPYFRAGLENNEFCVWVISQSFEIEEAKETLRRFIPDFDSYLENGQIEFIHYADWFLKDDVLDFQKVLDSWTEKLNHALTCGYDGLRAIENICWIENDRWNDFVDYEERLDSLINKYKMIVLCTYCHDACNVVETIDVISNHQMSLIRRKGKWERIDDFTRKNTTDLKQTEDTLQNTIQKSLHHKVTKAIEVERQRLFDVLDALPAMVALLTSDHHIAFTNRSFREKFGEHGGRHCYEFCFGKTQPCEFCEAYKVLETGKPHNWEVIIPDGNVIEVYNIPFTDIDNSPMILEMNVNVTERKKAEEALKNAYDTLEERVKERTAELENAYRSLKESQESLAEAQRIAHIGSWEWDIASDTAYWSEEMYRIFGLNPQEPAPGLNEFLGYIHPDDRDIIDKIIKKRSEGVFEGIDYRIIRANGEERTVYTQTEAIFDEKNIPIRVKGIVQDITERKKSEEKIQNLANIAESSNDAIITKSFDGIITSWSKGAEQVYGYSAEEVLGKNIAIIEPDNRKGEIEKLGERVKQGEIVHNYETQRLRKDGTIINVSITLSPVFDSSGKLVFISAIARDTTESKRAEEKLRESEEKYRNIVETSNEGIYFVNDEAKITFANKMMETSGYSLDEIIGKPVWNFIPEESLPVAEKEFEKRRKGISGSYELKLIRKDGSYIWAHITAKPFFNKKGKFKGYLAMMTDITERKKAEEKLQESEEKYRNIVETANEGILITDNKAIITYVNNKAVDTIGYTLEEVTGRPIWGFISEEYKPIVKKHLKKRQQRISESYELKLIHKNGSSIWVLLNAKPLFDKEGKFMGVMSMLTDITKRKEAEEALSNIETARKKEIHHRIKNNLQVISSLLDLQAEQFRNRENIKDSEVLEAFRESKDRVISMALIHEELYRGGGFETLDFLPYIEELAKNLLHTYRLGDTEINLKLDLVENTFFNMDIAVPLGIIVNELVSNSLKHAFVGRDKGEIQIKLYREEKEKCIKCIEKDHKSTTFVLIVSDNGVGIPEKLNIEATDTLGIQLVASLVEQLDGELELKRNKGTEFTISFCVGEKENW